MQLLKAAFPLYSIGSYEEIFESAPYRLIRTRHKTYVLDILYSDEPFQERRLRLLTVDPGYPIYRLKKRFTSLAQILNGRDKVFIDSTGKIYKITRTKHHKVSLHKVLHYERTYNGKFLLITKQGNYVTDQVYTFVTTITVSGVKVYMGGVNHPSEARRSYRL